MKEEVNPPPRLTRAERQRRTREALVDAAAEAFAARGFHGASVEDITARAGYTRGAFYSNFADKEDLLLAVLDRQDARDVAEVGPLVEGASSPGDLVARLRARGADPDVALQRQLLVHELRLHALRHPEVRPRLARWEQAQRAAYRAAVEHLFAASGLPLPADAELVALVVQVLDDGIGRHHQVEGDAIAPQAFLDALDLLIRAGVALAASEGGTGPPG